MQQFLDGQNSSVQPGNLENPNKIPIGTRTVGTGGIFFSSWKLQTSMGLKGSRRVGCSHTGTSIEHRPIPWLFAKKEGIA